MNKISNSYNDEAFWLEENLRYTKPHFRLEKCARIVNGLAKGAKCDLLDVGCGPATLGQLVAPNINYFGIDIAIQRAAPNLMALDIAHNEIKFGDKTFDIVVAGGLFEYLGEVQNKKFTEIQRLMKKNGKFVLTYTNFHHVNDKRIDHTIYNNVRPLHDFKRELEAYFRVERWFPSSHNWFVSEPQRSWLKDIQMGLEREIPIVSRKLAINYFFVCSLKPSKS